MYCCRIFVFILLVVFTAAATCSSLFPLMRAKVAGNATNVYYWYIDTQLIGTTYQRDYTRDLSCTTMKNFFIVSSALSVAGAAFGAIATMMAFAHLFHRPKCGLCVSIMFFALLACLCYVVCVALITNLYLSGKCGGKSFKNLDYKLREGYGLMVGAAGGFLITMFFEACS